MGRPLRITVCISDHGWGHLGRTLVLAAEAQRRGHALQLVVSESMAARAASALPGASLSAVVTGHLDQGYVVRPGGRGVDAEATRPLLAACAAGPDQALRAAVADWMPDVVLADATPWAPVLAHAAGAPAVLCSNFSWDDQYAALYAAEVQAHPDGHVARHVQAVQRHVAAFDLALEFPLGPGTPSVTTRRPMPLVGRRPGETETGLPRDRPVVTWAFGRTPPEAQPLDALRALARVVQAQGCVLATNEALRDALANSPETLLLPDHAPWPDVLAASRLVVSKAGYSTLAEALRGPGHVIAIGITGLAEEQAMQAHLANLGHGLGIPLTTPDLPAALEAAARTLLARPPRPPLTDTGKIVALDAVEALVG